MLHEFLASNRRAILALTKEKTAAISESKPSSSALERGLPEFYDHLVEVLKSQSKGGGKSQANRNSPSTTHHGREALRLGYTVSQVVHGYGVICQAITEMAEARGATISPGEFSTLNLSLDVAIADAVTGFEDAPPKDAGTDAGKRTAALVHELRNALTCAIVAHSMVAKGVVGTGGGTNAMLARNLQRMRELLDRAFSEIRLQNEQEAVRRHMRLLDAVEEVTLTAAEQARSKGLVLSVDVPPEIGVNADRSYLISAISNLVQNALKFSKRGGTVTVRGMERGDSVVLEVEDCCGGLPEGKAEELFKPFTQKGGDRTGLGLGLSISRHAVALNEGALSVRDLPGVGCVFSITLPSIRSAVKR